MIYKWMVKPALWGLDPERAHQLAAGMIASRWMRPLWRLNQVCRQKPAPSLATDLCGLSLGNPIGLAAGFDKNAQMFSALDRLGFGFVEIGTVTAKAQPGNPKPRLFRLPADSALINRMGFNNQGVDAAAERLAERRARAPVGGNIGKSKVTPLAEAEADYAYSFRRLHPYVDYFVVNVSSPNTPGLRELQGKAPLTRLLNGLGALNVAPRKPLLLKIAPDLTEPQLQDIAAVVEETGVDGVIAVNTTLSRDGLATPASRIETIGAGGLSGAPLRDPALRVIRFLRRALPERVHIVGVGGIFSGRDAYRAVRAGARCLQIYTGFVYEGPNVVFRIRRELAALLARDGFACVGDAVGADL